LSFTSNRFVGNTNYTQVEPLITVEKLKQTYLFGVLGFTDEEGNKLSDEAVQGFINSAISLLEHDLDLAIMPRRKEEHKDYFVNDYYEWGYLQLNNYPVISIESMRIVYLRDQYNLETVMDIPQQWIRLDPDTGIIRLIPNNRFPGTLAVNSGGAFFPELFNRNSHVPNLWVLEYTHGFKGGCVPVLVNSVIGLTAAITAMAVVGDLIVAPGIAGSSLSLDGLSQSIQTTLSAENNGLSGRIRDYLRQLHGDKTMGAPGMIDALRRYYKGSQINIV